MTLAGLALRNAFLRNRTRSLLTVAGVVVTSLAFVFLRTVLADWYSSAEASAADRVVTRNAVSIIQPLPLRYAQAIAQVPGVTRVTWSNWFGGTYKDPKNFFAQFAVDAPTALEVFELRFAQGTKDAFLGDRNSCLVGTNLAKRFGWKLGDTVPLGSQIYPGDWRFRIAALVENPEDASVANTMYFHWARLNEGMPEGRKDLVGVFTSRIANAADSPRVVRDIDALFANSDAETHTETEKAFRLQFVTGSAAILNALQIVSGVILLIMALILGNTLAMGLRERTGEIGALRALGFLPAHVRWLSVAEGGLIGLAGGLVGLVLSVPVLGFFRQVFRAIGFGFSLSPRPGIVVLVVVVAAVLGGLASLLPAAQAARLDVVEALRRQE